MADYVFKISLFLRKIKNYHLRYQEGDQMEDPKSLLVTFQIAVATMDQSYSRKQESLNRLADLEERGTSLERRKACDLFYENGNSLDLNAKATISLGGSEAIKNLKPVKDSVFSAEIILATARVDDELAKNICFPEENNLIKNRIKVSP